MALRRLQRSIPMLFPVNYLPFQDQVLALALSPVLLQEAVYALKHHKILYIPYRVHPVLFSTHSPKFEFFHG